MKLQSGNLFTHTASQQSIGDLRWKHSPFSIFLQMKEVTESFLFFSRTIPSITERNSGLLTFAISSLADVWRRQKRHQEW
jgi:hypothetical protein